MSAAEKKMFDTAHATSISKPKGLPVTTRFCKQCADYTTHEVRRGAGVVAKICRLCLARAIRYQVR
jgi:hypothetical protein